MEPQYPSPLHPKAKWLAMSGVGMGVLMSTLDSSMLNISLPTLVGEFRTDFATIQWVVLSYVLVLTSLILGAARLGDMVSKKKLYQGGLALFTLGSLLCALSPNVYWLIGFRAIQALGGVFTTALGIAIITEVFPSKERGRALGIQGSIVSVGIALGPPLGGLIIGTFGWHWVFLVNLPIGIAAVWIVHRFVPALQPARPNQRFDVLGAVLLFITLGLYALGMTYGQQNGFETATVKILLIGATLGLIIFIVNEKRAPQPMVDLSLFKNVLFGMNLLMALLLFIVLAGMFILPFYLELVKGYDTQIVGLLMMVNPIGMGLTAPIAGHLSDRYGSRIISLIGLVVVIAAALLLSTLSVDTTPIGFLGRTFFVGLGMGLFQSPNNSAVMGTVPRDRLGVASGLLALSRTLGHTTGIPLIGAIFTASVLSVSSIPGIHSISDAEPAALVSGIQQTFQIAALFILASTLIAILALWIDHRRKGNLLSQR